MSRLRVHPLLFACLGIGAGLTVAPCRADDGTADAAAPGRRTPIAEVVFAAIDTETTGFSPAQDRIVEIAAITFRGGEVLARRSWLIHPGRDIPYWAERVHHISDAMVADQPSFEAVYPEFTAFVGDAVMLAHNARFDIAFISAEANRRGLPLPGNKVLDTLPLFRAWFPGAESYSLEGLAQFLEGGDTGFHRAEDDSAHVLSFLREGLSRHPDVQNLGDLERAAGGEMGF